jgi:sugar lactone lactonase YvrE
VGYTEAPSGPTPNTGVVTTIAGDGSEGFADGIGTEAIVEAPSGVAVRPDGTIVFISNNRIRLISPAGVVTTFAGSGSYGFADGIGAAAEFKGPLGVAVRPDGIIVVADTSNHSIRLVTPEGVVTTLAGDARTGGYADGIGQAALFNYPSGVAILSNGNIVVADTSNRRIRLVDFATGAVTTLAGSTLGYADGIGSAAKFRGPLGIAVLPNGLIVVADTGGNRIRLVTPGGVVTTLAGDGTEGFADGIGTAARFAGPNGIAVLPTSSLIAVADLANNRIRLVSPTGIVTTLAGSESGFADGIGPAANFFVPFAVAVVPSSGAIVVSDEMNNRIRLVTGAF